MAELLQYRIDMEPQSRWRIVTVDPAAKPGLLHLQEAGDFHARRGYYTKRRGLDSYLLKITLSGRGVLEYGGQRIPQEPGCFFWIDCQLPQYYGIDPEAGCWRVMWVHFFGPTAQAYYQAFLTASQGSPAGRLPDRAPAVQAIERLLALYDRTGSSLSADIRASAILTGLLAECVSALTAESVPAIPQVMRDVRDCLLADYAGPLTLDSLSAGGIPHSGADGQRQAAPAHNGPAGGGGGLCGGLRDSQPFHQRLPRPRASHPAKIPEAVGQRLGRKKVKNGFCG